ncbi:MAG: hypothetical protein EBW39_09325 [Betaproteobacteria bacterium]|nr:hypothetical protein [Betaproteobacteria bacterium]
MIRYGRRLFGALMAAFCMAQASANPAVEPRQRYQLLVGDSVLIPTHGMYRVSVGNARAIQAVPVDQNELLLIAEAAGFSRVHVWEKGSVKSLEVTVLSSHLERVLEEARAALAVDSKLRVEQQGNRVVVDGVSMSSAERHRLGELGKRYSELTVLAHGSSAESIAQVDLYFVEVKREKLDQLGIRWNPFAQDQPQPVFPQSEFVSQTRFGASICLVHP